MIKSITLIMEVDLSMSTITMGSGLVLIQPGVQALDTNRHSQDQQQAIGGDKTIYRQFSQYCSSFLVVVTQI